MKRLTQVWLAFCTAMMFLTGEADAQLLGMRSLGYQEMNSLAAATALPSVPSGTVEAFIVCETQNVRWRDDGTNPTASVGTLLIPSQPFPYIASIPALKIIQTTASAACHVTYYGY